MSEKRREDSNALYNLSVTSIAGERSTLEQYRGKVMLIVNVASRCGFTPQYEALERLFRTHQAEGLVVLGFPCDQFGGQEPGTAEEIRAFCDETYGVTFPMFAKVDVNGRNAHPLFVLLKKQRGGWLGFGRITWNFTKFLVDRHGRVVGRYGATTAPARIEPEILRQLRESSASLSVSGSEKR